MLTRVIFSEEAKVEITDQTETNLVALRRTIYLAVQSSLSFEECAHKILKMEFEERDYVSAFRLFWQFARASLSEPLFSFMYSLVVMMRFQGSFMSDMALNYFLLTLCDQTTPWATTAKSQMQLWWLSFFQPEICAMIVDCCSQLRTYEKFFGLLGGVSSIICFFLLFGDSCSRLPFPWPVPSKGYVASESSCKRLQGAYWLFECLSSHCSGFPRGIESIEKVLNFKIGFQDLEKVLNFAKTYSRYWKSMEILNWEEIRSIWAYLYWRQSTSLFMLCVKFGFMIKNFEKWREVKVLNLLNLVLKKYGK